MINHQEIKGDNSYGEVMHEVVMIMKILANRSLEAKSKLLCMMVLQICNPQER